MTSLGRKTEITPDNIQKMLDDNSQLIQAIVETQNKGRAVDAMQYQQMLYKNLLYLAGLVDPNMNTRDLLPKPNVPRPVDHGGGHMQGYPGHQISGHHTPSPHPHPSMPAASYGSSPYMTSMGMPVSRQPMSQPNGQYLSSGGGQVQQAMMQPTAGYQPPPTSSLGLTAQQMHSEAVRQHLMTQMHQDQMMHANVGSNPHGQMVSVPSYSPSQGIPPGIQSGPRQPAPSQIPPPTYTQPQI